MNRLEFLGKLQPARAEWDALVAQAQARNNGVEAVISEPGEGDWSLKDLVAHNIWYQSEIVRLLKARNLSFEPSDKLWAMRDDERNKAIYDMYHDKPLSVVLAEEQQVYKELLAEVRMLGDEDFNDPRRFNDMPVDWIPWRVFAENSYEHYTSHLDDLKGLIQAE